MPSREAFHYCLLTLPSYSYKKYLVDFKTEKFDKEGNEILFNLLSNRNDSGSILITSNLVFDRWEEVFKDPVLTGALVDRLAHKAHVLDMSGESYRIKETLEWRK